MFDVSLSIRRLALVVAIGISVLCLLPTSSVWAVAPAPYSSQDPCAPDASGAVPPMCQGGATPIDPSGPFFDATFTQLVTGDAVSRRVFDVAAGTISYSAGRLSASVGCNQLAADATLQLGGPLVLTSPILATKMYCEGLMEAEAALILILEGGDLQLTSDGITGSAGLIRIEGGVMLAMPGGVKPGGGGFAPDDSGSPILTIESGGESYAIENGRFSLGGGRLSASVGCNSIGGEAQLSGDRIVISGSLMQTEMYCEGLMEAEVALAAVLNGANLRFSSAYTITSDAGSFTIAPTLCGPGCPPSPSDAGFGTLFGALILLLPVGVLAWLALRRSTSRSRPTRRTANRRSRA